MKFSINKYYLLGLSLLITGLFTGCAKFVDKPPLDNFSNDEYWTSETNVRTYNWGFYELFTGFGTGTNGDFYFSWLSDDQTPSGFTNFTLTAPASDSRWTFAYIRKANIMLENVDNVPMDEEAKNHWKGVARFFRALSYFRLVKVFGDVPWINKSLDISETDVIYKARDSRALVMDSVMADLQYAYANLRDEDQDNTVNKNVALALISRVGLYAGTYRKYHTELNLPDAKKYLQDAKDASEKLMSAGYSLNADFRTVYSSLDLSGDKECILYKQYEPGVLTHSVIGYTNSSTTMAGLSKNAVESFVCTDGLPIGLSSEYEGDADLDHTRANRDHRLLESISDFLCYKTHLVGGLSASTGYRPAKFLQPADENQLAPYNSTDAPIFWLPEILDNYAEACAELDDLGAYTMTQADLDKSVNLLRARSGVAALQVTGHQGTAIDGVSFTDPDKDSDVPSLIWEIRRERRAELMMCGFRFYDLMRWKKGEKLDNTVNPDIFLGAKVPAAEGITLTSDGYLQPYSSSSNRTFADKNYLSPVPTGQISLYPTEIQDGMQNTGW
ncbi:Starch-binding associating with outer membrane [Arachidicoccus rhizosphaerae]|uniref:Starch-binding associating with outer membrane n=1 Tax=Arachidicoccus rhizosphaerae TaxID=551991 RepID=A0A1H4APN9_9BACT|nr:RagB/SusD family nutrient uptake outer membrane protein [Arachidicoccus rhizosphaerae]SEA37866.1 Starch-binding associating with outer membrane [Arachidicoccus rhizosphaerae]